MCSSESLHTLHRRLLTWYRRTARELPWRGRSCPYPIWVSEIMLQQTQTQTVEPYYHRFLAAFPTIQSLAAAPLETVHRLWEGLGYYRRATLLHTAAQRIVSQHGGHFPTRYEDVLALPGIGKYTAGAILSIAFDQRLPILEANTIRLHARLLGMTGDTKTATHQKELWQAAETILPQKKAGIVNQALMDLGSLVCTPTQPKCEECPISSWCVARQTGLQDKIPFAKPKVPPENRFELAVLLKRRGRVFVMRYPPTGRWANLWDFPRIGLNIEDVEVGAKSCALDEPYEHVRLHEAQRRISLLTGMNIQLQPQQVLGEVKHSVTRFRITCRLYSGILADTVSDDVGTPTSTSPSTSQTSTPKPLSPSESSSDQRQESRWVPWDELHTLPFHSSGRKLLHKIYCCASKN